MKVQIINIIYKLLKNKLENFEKEKIKLEEFDLKKYGIDILFFTTSNLINSCFDINNDFTPSIFYKNFYKNVLVPLFRECDFKTNKTFNAMKIFYDPEKFESIKRSFEIKSKDMKILLYSYRWFLNEIYSLAEEGKNDSLYSKFYMGNFDNIKNYYYPGNDIHNSIPKYELLSNIVSHFSGPNSRMGCYVCLRGNGWYHNDTHLRCSKPLKDKKCDNCNEVLWKVCGYVSKELKPVFDDRYLRIFKDDQDKINNKKFWLDYKINHLTIDKFKEKYVKKYFEREKGITHIDEEHLKKTNKVIRDLSQVSYRLLNFILYSNLFFARIYTENKKFDSFLPKNMSWIRMLTTCWKLLEKELYKKNINSIELFMNYIFFDLFNLLNKQEEIKPMKYWRNLKIS